MPHLLPFTNLNRIKQLFWFGIESKIEQLVPLNFRYILRNLDIVKNSNQQRDTTRESLFNSKSDSLETQLNLSLTYATIYLIGISLAIVCFLLEWLVHLIKDSQRILPNGDKLWENQLIHQQGSD